LNTVVNKPWLSRLSVPFLVLVLIAPMVSAWIVFKYYPELVRSLGTSNYGTFIVPPVKLDMDGLSQADGKPVPADVFDKKWTYVYLNKGICDKTCFDHLMLMKNVRLSQGKEISRMKRLFITSSEVNGELDKLIKQFPNMRTVRLGNDKQENDIRALFSSKDQPDPFVSHSIYIIDPDAKLMMHYKDDRKDKTTTGLAKEDIIQLGKGMQDDMSKLMKNSKLRK